MDANIKAKWLAALRSGKYEQATEVLQRPGTNEYCCLGVLCDIALQEGVAKVFNEDTPIKGVRFFDMVGAFSEEQLPPGVAAWAGLEQNPEVITHDDDECDYEYDERHDGGDCRCGTYTSLAELNDGGHSFAEIAEYIETQL